MGVIDFARAAPRPDLDAANNTLILTEAFRYSIPMPLLLEPAATHNLIYGVALIWDRQSEQLYPTVLLDASVSGQSGELQEIGSVPAVHQMIRVVIGQSTEWLSTVRVMGTTPFQEQLSPGDVISAQLRGTVGCGVRWSNRYGFLTAGHVATLNSGIAAGGQIVGSVVYSNNPVGHGFKVEEDVAVIELHSGHSFSQTISKLGVARAGDKVSIQSSTPPKSAQIQGYATSFNSPNSNATYGELYLTYGQVTQPGDSGAAVLDSQGMLIGHVIGGSPGVFSYIQEVHYQLQMIGSQSSFSGIRLS